MPHIFTSHNQLPIYSTIEQKRNSLAAESQHPLDSPLSQERLVLFFLSINHNHLISLKNLPSFTLPQLGQLLQYHQDKQT
jgi:hypothetical protein